jgi:hypothetical protein
MSVLSRRGFLVAAAVCAVSVGTAAAPALADCAPATDPVSPMSATGQQGTASVSVELTLLQDVTAIQYTLTNISDAPDIYTVTYNDQVTGRDSRESVIQLPAGGVQSTVVYGSLNHKFTFNVGLSDGTTLTLGPLGTLPACRLSNRKPPTPIYRPGRDMTHATLSPGPTPATSGSGQPGPSSAPTPWAG